MMRAQKPAGTIPLDTHRRAGVRERWSQSQSHALASTSFRGKDVSKREGGCKNDGINKVGRIAFKKIVRIITLEKL